MNEKKIKIKNILSFLIEYWIQEAIIISMIIIFIFNFNSSEIETIPTGSVSDSTENADTISEDDDDTTLLEGNSDYSIESDQEPQVIQEDQEVTVDLKGAIASPGVYTLEEGKRVNDLILIGGGFVSANEECVNLAKKLEDEEVVYIPYSTEECTGAEQGTSGSTEESNLVNINTATLEELQTISGIGESKAQAIIDYREENGNFQNIEDLQNVPGIGESTFNNLKETIAV